MDLRTPATEIFDMIDVSQRVLLLWLALLWRGRLKKCGICDGGENKSVSGAEPDARPCMAKRLGIHLQQQKFHQL